MQSFLKPRWFFLSYWLLALLATKLIHPSGTLDGFGMFVILVFVTAFTFGVVLATVGLNFGSYNKSALIDFDKRTLKAGVILFSTLVGSIANILAALLSLQSNKLSVVEILTLQGLANSANIQAVARYNLEGVDYLIPLLLGIGYVAALVAPFIRLTSIKRKLLVILFPLVSSLLYASVSSARLGFLLAISLTCGGLIATYFYENGNPPKIKIKTLLTTVLVTTLVAIIFIGIGALRIGRFEESTVRLSLGKQIAYTVGQVDAFSTWLDRYDSQVPLGFGTASIAGLEFITGQERSDTRARTEFTIVDDSGVRTNVYTAFRGLLLDFGPALGLLFTSVLGFGFGRVSLQSSRGSVTSAAILGFGYATLLMSPWIAITTFSNVLIVLLVSPIVLKLSTSTSYSTIRNSII